MSKHIGASFRSSDYADDPSLCAKLVLSLSIDPLATFEYDALGRVSAITYGDGVEESNQYDPDRGWISRRDYVKGANTLFYFENQYDDVGNITRQDYSNDYFTAHYDSLYRLVYTSGVYTEFSYDPNGNITNLILTVLLLPMATRLAHITTVFGQRVEQILFTT